MYISAQSGVRFAPCVSFVVQIRWGSWRTENALQIWDFASGKVQQGLTPIFF